MLNRQTRQSSLGVVQREGKECYVGGAWIGTAEAPLMNPATGAVLAKVPRFGAGKTREAIVEKATGCCR